jgi:hypothetical protein
MNWLELSLEHETIRETVGYSVIEKIELEDIPTVMEFLKIVHNYIKMINIKNNTK